MEYYGMHDLQSSEQLCITWPTILIAKNILIFQNPILSQVHKIIRSSFKK